MNSNDEKNNANGASGEDSNIEKITKIPSPMQAETLVIKQKIKDPKKVAAGRKLAEYNKKAKEKQKLVLASAQSESTKNNDSNSSGDTSDDYSNNFLPETSFTTIIAFLGLGLTAIDLFMRYKSSKLSQETQPIYTSNTISPQLAAQSDYDDISNSKNDIGSQLIMPRLPSKTIGME